MLFVYSCEEFLELLHLHVLNAKAMLISIKVKQIKKIISKTAEDMGILPLIQ